MQEPTTVIVFDPYIIGHHVHKLSFTLNELKKITGLTVLPVANKRKTPDCMGYCWNQTKSQSPPILLFFRYIILMVNILRSARGRRVLLNNAYDNTWKHFGLLAIVLVPLVRALKIHLLCLQFRTNYLREIGSLTDLFQRLAYKILHVGLGQSFSLLVTQERHANAAERIEYLPDLHDIPEVMPSREEARERLGLPLDGRMILFFGSVEERRRGFELLVRNFDVVPSDWRLLITSPSVGNYERFIVSNFARIRLINREVNHAEKVNAFRASDLVIILYPESFAGSSGIMTDAIMYERPVMITRFRYAEEILSKYNIGVFIEDSSRESFQKAFSSFVKGNYSQEITRCKKDMIEIFRSQIRKVVLEESLASH